MDYFEYQNLWLAYTGALAVLGVSGYFIIKPIPFAWFRWLTTLAVIVFLAAPIQVSDNWMVPSILYFVFEYYFVGNQEAIAVLYQLIQHVVVAVVAVSLMFITHKLMNRDKKLQATEE